MRAVAAYPGRFRPIASVPSNAMQQGTWTIRPCPHRESSLLARELGLSEITASVLVRRGYGDPDEARAFLAGEQPLHGPFLLGDMAAACEAIRGAVDAGKPICVHGDYDADGICATALAVLTLRELGADVSWHLPSRFDEGYGISGETLTRLAGEGCGLVLSVDCGITAVQAVPAARALGLEVVVTDHHQPGERLPDCPLVVTRPSDYPFPELCGTGVVFKLAQALLGPDSEPLRRHLDLVALATVADVVPLLSENRSLAIAGLRALTRTRKPGLRALMKTARVDPAALDESSIGYRLAPRINAAGRLGHPATALELLLTEDAERAERLAIDPTRVDAFAEAFAEHADAVLPEDELRPVAQVDAVLPRGRPLTLELCAELRSLAPFGLGNPPVTLLAPGCELVDLAAVGEGKHLRFRVKHETGQDAGSAIAFRRGPELDRYRRVARYDVAFRLEENHWNGTVAPQLVVQRIFDTPEAYLELVARFERSWRSPPSDLAAVLEELGVGDGAPKRHLLESKAFRDLLAEPELAAAA